MNIKNLGANVCVVEGFLSDAECDEFIAKSNAMQYELAEIQTREGSRVLEDVRNNDRVIFDDPALADFIFARAKAFLPPTLGDDWYLSGLNERFRFYRYKPGQYFKWHKDGFYCRSDAEVSQLTLMMYLNDDYKGGETEFRWETIQPKRGMALVFPHIMTHQGASIESGTKYVLRTDVMYRTPFPRKRG